MSICKKRDGVWLIRWWEGGRNRSLQVHGSHELAKKVERKKLSARDENRHLDVRREVNFRMTTLIKRYREEYATKKKSYDRERSVLDGIQQELGTLFVLRRSRKVTHFRSVKVTHLKNRISVLSRIIIHAAGVCSCLRRCGGSISSAPKARSVRGLWKERRSYWAGVERWSLLRRCRKYSGPILSCSTSSITGAKYASDRILPSGGASADLTERRAAASINAFSTVVSGTPRSCS